MTAPSKPSNAPVVPDDWPAQAAGRIEGLVGTVRDKTTGPVMTAARWAVYGVIMLIVGIAAVILLTALIVRIVNAYLPDAWVGEQHVWVTYLLLGVPTTAAGLWLLSKAKHPESAQK